MSAQPRTPCAAPGPPLAFVGFPPSSLAAPRRRVAAVPAVPAAAHSRPRSLPRSRDDLAASQSALLRAASGARAAARRRPRTPGGPASPCAAATTRSMSSLPASARGGAGAPPSPAATASSSPDRRLRRAAAATAALHLPAVALLVLRAAAPGALRPAVAALAALGFPPTGARRALALPPSRPQDRVLCLALSVITPELLRVVFDNFRACAIFSRRGEQYSAAPAKTETATADGDGSADATAAVGAGRRRSGASREVLAQSVKIHYALTVVVAAAQLAGLYTAAIFPAPGCIATIVCTGLFYSARRVRFEPQRLGRAHRVDPAEYRDVIIACSASALLVLGAHFGILPLVLSSTTLIMSMFYWVCKWTFVPR